MLRTSLLGVSFSAAAIRMVTIDVCRAATVCRDTREIPLPNGYIDPRTGAPKELQLLRDTLVHAVGKEGAFQRPRRIFAGIPSVATYTHVVPPTATPIEMDNPKDISRLSGILPGHKAQLVTAVSALMRGRVECRPETSTLSPMLVAARREVIAAYIGLFGLLERFLVGISTNQIAAYNLCCVAHATLIRDRNVVISVGRDGIEVSYWLNHAITHTSQIPGGRPAEVEELILQEPFSEGCTRGSDKRFFLVGEGAQTRQIASALRAKGLDVVNACVTSVFGGMEGCAREMGHERVPSELASGRYDEAVGLLAQHLCEC